MEEEPYRAVRASANVFTLRDMIDVLRKGWLVIAGVVLAVILMATAYVVLAPKKYTATTQLLAISVQSASADTHADLSQLSTGASYIQTQIATYPQLVKTEKVLSPVIAELGLREGIQSIASMVTAQNPSGTFMVNVSATTTDPELSKQLSNAVAESLNNVISTAHEDSSKSLVSLDIVQHASTPTSPSAPRTKLIISAAIVGGLILGYAVALLRRILNTKITGHSDVQTVADLSILGSIPNDSDLNSNQSVIVKQSESAVAEDYRKIRTNITFLSTDKNSNRGHLIVVCSSSPSEGKTTTAVNIAASLAEDNKKVLLIDADLRHPSVAHKLGIEGSIGLTHILSGLATPSDAVQSYWKPNFHILPAGLRPANASILLNSDTMEALIHHALAQYEYVILDTTPMSVSHDGLVFGKIAQGVLLIVGRGICDKRDLADTLNSFATAKIPVLGYVLNFAMKKKADRKYYYYESYDSEAKRKGKATRSRESRRH